MRGGRWLFMVVCALAAMLAGCGDDSSSPSPSPSAARTQTQTPASTQTEPPTRTKPVLVPNRWKEPRWGNIGAHPDAKVKRVIVHDVAKGTGRAVRRGDAVVVDFIQANYTNGEMFYRAWGGAPWATEEIVLTPLHVMRGFTIGMLGMRPGGRRTIIVPKHLSDIHDTDRTGYSYYEIVYFDVVLRGIADNFYEASGKPIPRGPRT